MTAKKAKDDDPRPGDRVRFHVDEEDRVVDDSGRVYDLGEAILATNWVTATRYPPPHQYAVLGRTPIEPWDVIATAIRGRSDSYLAYFRGYRRPNRYLDLPDHRYWRTSSGGTGGRVTHMLNRCTYDSAEPPRRLDEGAVPIEWSGPPWDVYGAPWPPGWRYDDAIDRWVDPAGRPLNHGRRIGRRRDVRAS
jgi:hypothetical protein